MMLERLWLRKDDPPHPQNFGIKDISLSFTSSHVETWMTASP
jgi:hypothetical protein